MVVKVLDIPNTVIFVKTVACPNSGKYTVHMVMKMVVKILDIPDTVIIVRPVARQNSGKYIVQSAEELFSNPFS